jgi:hypothetical protein
MKAAHFAAIIPELFSAQNASDRVPVSTIWAAIFDMFSGEWNPRLWLTGSVVADLASEEISSMSCKN